MAHRPTTRSATASPTTTSSSRSRTRNPFRLNKRPGTAGNLGHRRRLEHLGGDPTASRALSLRRDFGCATRAATSGHEAEQLRQPDSLSPAHGELAPPIPAGINDCAVLLRHSVKVVPGELRQRLLVGDRHSLLHRRQLPSRIRERCLVRRCVAPVHLGDVSRRRRPAGPATSSAAVAGLGPRRRHRDGRRRQALLRRLRPRPDLPRRLLRLERAAAAGDRRDPHRRDLPAARELQRCRVERSGGRHQPDLRVGPGQRRRLRRRRRGHRQLHLRAARRTHGAPARHGHVRRLGSRDDPDLGRQHAGRDDRRAVPNHLGGGDPVNYQLAATDSGRQPAGVSALARSDHASLRHADETATPTRSLDQRRGQRLVPRARHDTRRSSSCA